MAQVEDIRSNRSSLAGQGHRSVVGLALGMAALFFAIVAVLINTPVLFYMGTALIATIAASRLQAWLSVRGLRFRRQPPDSVQVGDWVTVGIEVWSERKVRRPLMTVSDALPQRLIYSDRSISTPIAPAYDLPIRTQYRFRALRRGVYRWSGIEAVGTDALGLVVMSRVYETEPVELTVLPRPIPIHIELPAASGWGISEAESGQSRGAGLEPRGVREYASGDSLRHIHWSSTARRGQLLVKEFEAGSHTAASIFLQTTKGSDLGVGADTTLETMCGHAAYLAERLMTSGALVQFPAQEEKPSRASGAERLNQIYELLAKVTAGEPEMLSAVIERRITAVPAGSILILMMTIADPSLPGLVRRLRGTGVQCVILVYDPRQSGLTRVPLGTVLACDPQYLEQLEGAGATVHMADRGETL